MASIVMGEYLWRTLYIYGLQHRFFSVCLVLREYFQQNFQKRLTESPSLTMADGVFTPAVSVTSAVGGIAVAKPSVSSDIIPISIVGIQSIHFFGLNLTTCPTGLSSGLVLGTTIWNIPLGFHLRTKYLT